MGRSTALTGEEAVSVPASLPPSLRARVMDAARAQPSPSRARVRQAVVRTTVAGALACLAIFFLVGGFNLTRRPPAFVALTVLGWGAIALLATWGGVARGRSMLGRPTGWLVMVALLTVPSLFAWMLVATATWPELRGTPSADVHAHVGCFVATTLLTLGPFVALVLARRRTDPVHPRATGAAIGAAAGAWGVVMIDLHCPVSATLHVGLAHLGPIALFALAGALLGRRFIGIRVSPRE